jgi:hypothetical protein
MRFHSTTESVGNGEITQLALIECVVAASAYVLVGIHLGTFRHLALPIAFAPLLLLRTEGSMRWGLLKYEQVSNTLAEVAAGGSWMATPIWLLFGVLAAFAGCGIRIVSTLFWAAKNPLATLRLIPQNWVRQSFCTDFFFAPEIVPGESQMRDSPTSPILPFRDVLKEVIRAEHKWFVFVFLALPLLVIGFLPSLCYRISFKATALAYAPFVWVAHVTLDSSKEVKFRLKRITNGELEKTRRWLSGLIVSAIGAKVALSRGWVDVSAVLAKFPSQRLIESLLIPRVWPWWVITLGIDALLTFSLLYYADAALARIEGNHPWGGAAVGPTISTVSFVRASLSIATMSHFFLVALMSVAGKWIT